MMQNGFYQIGFNEENGGISVLSLQGDKNRMNFCKKGKTLFTVRGFLLETFEEGDVQAKVVSSFQGVKATTKYFFENENLVVSTVLKNENTHPVYYRTGDIALEIPFNDAYESSEICMKERCHAHIWTGLENSYLCLERMGESEYNLGVWFEKGSFSSYDQEDCTHSNRGVFLLNVSAFVLKSGEEYEIKYTVFRHSGQEDFFAKASALNGYLQVQSEKGYTVTVEEWVEFSVEANEEIAQARCIVDGEEATCHIENKKAIFSFQARTVKEYEAVFTVNNRKGKAVFNAVSDLETLLKTRIHFIIENQQCLDETSPLYGAYLIYDNEENCQYFNYVWTDHNANRERMGIALTIVKWLQTHRDEKVEQSLSIFTGFLLRECVDEEKGTCYDNIGKDERIVRLYNAPWVILYFTELYKLTNERRWIELVVRILRYYYDIGGAKFYPNGIRFYTVYEEIQRAGLKEEAEEVYGLFNEHVHTIVKNGVVYPPHEVNFEQTIVTPAVSFLLDKYLISKEDFYLREAEKHLKILRKFDGKQPHYRLNTIPIRFWDDYWFGKNGIYGDVFPHYWSTLSGYGYYLYWKATGKEESLILAENCLKNCLCNIFANGRATCAYIFPACVKGTAHLRGKEEWKKELIDQRKGQFSDAFANDQDFGLYFLMKMINDLKESKGGEK